MRYKGGADWNTGMDIYALILGISGAAFTAGPLADMQAAIQLDRVKSLEVSWRWCWPGFWSHDGCYCPPPQASRTAVSKVFFNKKNEL